MTDAERAILDRMVEPEFPGRDELAAQLATARVAAESRGEDPCILLAIDPATPAAPVRYRVPIDAEGPDVDGAPIALLLHVVDGRAQELEVYRKDGEIVERLPRADEVDVVPLA